MVNANAKDLFRTISNLLNQPTKPLPVHVSDEALCNKFAYFFKEKIDKIRNELDEMSISTEVDSGIVESTTYGLNVFEPVSMDEVEKVIRRLSNKTSALDHLPTWLLKQNLHVVVPTITRIVNMSLRSSTFPDLLKHAIVTPILKKPSLDQNILMNYRPVSNIPFLAKVIESVVASKFKDYLNVHGLDEAMQSAYRKGHSTETALLKVHGDILRELDNNRMVLLVMLDLTAAFDTINHNTLFHRLETDLGVTGPPLAWFRSYMLNRYSRVSINGQCSRDVLLDCGVPQGSIMGPLVFTTYILPLGNIIRSHNLLFHIYADDTQVYSSYDPKNQAEYLNSLKSLEMCITDIRNWMTSNKLKLNMEKTEFLIIGSSHNLRSHPVLTLKIGTNVVKPVKSVRNLGVIMDRDGSMTSHVRGLCRTLNYQLRNIARIRKYLDEDTCHHIVRALVLSRIDYGNSLLAGITTAHFNSLQRIQNKAVRLICGAKRREHISPYMTRLHWLPVRQRVNFKLLVFMYQSINGSAPEYLSSDIVLYNTQSSSHRYLRSSADHTRLHIPKTCRSFGDKAFSVAGPRLWNMLPLFIREAVSLNVFKKLLKTYLFSHNV